MKRVAKFEKVSFERFRQDWLETFEKPFYQAEDEKVEYEHFLDDEIKDEYDNIKIPERATRYSAGYDFFAPSSYKLNPGETLKIPTGIRSWIDTDWVLTVFPRSSLGFKYQMMLCNTVGIIDADYYYSDNEGHIFIKLVNNGDKRINISEGSAFAQGIFLPYGVTDGDCVKTTRNGGFGSTNKKE